MCGVVGFWQPNSRFVSRDVLGRMLAAIPHRGPDDQGTWSDGPFGLGHVRLSILDLSARGHQPFITTDQLGALSFGGEIYNYRELRRELKQAGVPFRSTTDTEVVLNALHHWGPEAAIARLSGMFALAYCDLRTQTLWLARDRAGMKPFYLHRREGLVVFASEIKALIRHPDVPCEPDMHALTTQLVYGRLTGAWTPFQGVECILPGTLTRVDASGIETMVFHDVLRDLDVERLLSGGQQPLSAHQDSLQRLLAENVQSHLVSDVPVATMCSGGVDSSLITAITKQVKPDVEAYVADIPDDQVGEGDKAARVCDHLGVKLHRIRVSEAQYLRLWPEATLHNDQANFLNANILVLAVARAARADGFKVLLAGEGADELFGGYHWHRRTWQQWRRRRLKARWLPNLRLVRAITQHLDKLTPVDIEASQHQPFGGISAFWPGQKPTRIAVGLDGAQRSVREAALFKKLAPIEPIEDRAFLACSLEDVYSYLRTIVTSNEKMMMAASVESRLPFLSNDVLDMGLHTPRSAKFHRMSGKQVVKAVAEAHLPHDIVHAPKMGFGTSPRYWQSVSPLLDNGRLADMFKWGASEYETLSASIRSNPLLLFNLASMEMWARLYFDGASTEALGEQLNQLHADAV